MIVDHKKPNPDGSTTQPELVPEASTSERKLSIKVPNPRQIYTTGSTVAGIVHLSSKDLEKVQEVQVSLVCSVRSIHHRYLGGYSHDVRRETTKLVHRDQTIWTSECGSSTTPPATLPFEIIIPDAGNDTRAKNPNTPLPPSFHAGRHRGWKNAMTYGTPIGYIKYYAKVSVIKRGMLKGKDRAFCPFLFLPPSPPPQLLPPLPESLPDGEFSLPEDDWCVERSENTLRNNVFSTAGHAFLSLWLPRVSSFPRRTAVPFFLCLTLDILDAEAAQLSKATLFFRQTIRTCARGGRQTHVTTLDKAPTDNLLHGLVPQVDGGRIVWRGLWPSRDAPSFVNRQLTLEYSLIAEVPIKGLGNGAKVVTPPLEISSGITAGANISQSEDDALDMPPEYFEADGSMADDDEDDNRHVSDKKEKA